MKDLLREPDLVRMGWLKSILETHGIPVAIRNENECSALGISRLGAPRLEPSLCVVDESDYERALGILREHLESEDEKSREEIPCAACGELNPGNFEICWNCGGEVIPSGGLEEGGGP